MKKSFKEIGKKYKINVEFDSGGKLTKRSKRELKNKVNWNNISIDQKLSEDFIREFKNKVNWNCISTYQKLSEGFIREFKDKVNWYWISISQKLSEGFIREFKDKVDWIYISKYQKLSEDFIREFKDKVYWRCISINQKLSEDFIREFKDNVCWNLISKYQKLSKEFRKEFNLIIPDTCWLYKPVNYKLKYIKENADYEVIDNKYIIAYKAVRSDGHSVFNWHYKYEVGRECEAHCDCNVNNDNSFGLSAWTLEGVKKYYDKGKILKVKIAIKDIGAVVQNNQKIRCRKLTVIKYFFA